MFNLFLVTLAVGALGSQNSGLPEFLEKRETIHHVKDGEEIDRYTLDKILGRGRENAAFLATNQEGAKVVLKTTFIRGKRSADYEADWLSKMHHKNSAYFPEIYGKKYFEYKEVDFIAMEYLDGYDNLLEYMKLNAGKIPGRVATEMMVQMLTALNIIHTTKKGRGNYAHGDFHGENIMVKVDGDTVEVKIIDPHQGSPPFKIPQPHTDMVWAARHFITLTRGEKEIRELIQKSKEAGGDGRLAAREAMKNADMDEIKRTYRKVYEYLQHLLSPKKFAQLKTGADTAKLELSCRKKNVNTAEEMLKFIRTVKEEKLPGDLFSKNHVGGWDLLDWYTNAEWYDGEEYDSEGNIIQPKESDEERPPLQLKRSGTKSFCNPHYTDRSDKNPRPALPELYKKISVQRNGPKCARDANTANQNGRVGNSKAAGKFVSGWKGLRNGPPNSPRASSPRQIRQGASPKVDG